MAIHFIPVLAEEVELIRKSADGAGARFDSVRLRDRAASPLPLVIPVFISAFKRADELALAMEARGYRARGGGPVDEGCPPGAGFGGVDDHGGHLCRSNFSVRGIEATGGSKRAGRRAGLPDHKTGGRRE